MRVGMTVVFQNPHDVQSDHAVYADELHLADLAEPLGFDSIWGVEHHFTDYTMCPDVLEFLTYMAGRTRRVQLGSMVVVLPWHDPVRVAEQVSMLDTMSQGRFGVGILIIPQKPWDVVRDELAQYRTAYREVNGTDPLPTVCAGWTFCDPDAGRAREMAVRYIGGYWDSVLRHYELAKDHLKHTKGYEYYGRMSEIAAEHGTDALSEFFLSLQVWGTPEQCHAKVADIRERVGCDTFVACFRYAGMPVDEAERSMRLFASEVMPELKTLGTEDLAHPAPAEPRASSA